jgi:hypothetical protein
MKVEKSPDLTFNFQITCKKQISVKFNGEIFKKKMINTKDLNENG